MPAQRDVLIAIGANSGNPQAAVRAAVAQLRTRAASDFACSRFYRTQPVDCPPGAPDFINAAVAFRAHAHESAPALLRWLQSIEVAHGRSRGAIRNSPRELDLDLILFRHCVKDDATLTLPHPRALQRAFVLEPAAEVAGAMHWPASDATVLDLRNRLRAQLGWVAAGADAHDSSQLWQMLGIERLPDC